MRRRLHPSLSRSGYRAFLLLLLVLLLLGVLLMGCQTTRQMPEPAAAAPTEAPLRDLIIATSPELQEGQRVYDLRCAHCHGDNGDGQLPITIPTAEYLGLHIVPAQDASGHTWMHPTQRLRDIIRYGVNNPLQQFPMPGFEGVMTEEEIDLVIAYMALWWTEDQRTWQRQVTEYHATLEAQYPTPIPGVGEGIDIE